MSSSVRAAAITLVAPTAWGSTYLIAGQFLPPDNPVYAALIRALPAGVILLAIRRQLPRGVWWLRATVLGGLNFACFFPLVFIGAFHLPGGVAATVQAGSPIVVMALAWLLLREKAGWLRIIAGLVGLVGVAILVLEGGGGTVDVAGVLAAAGSVLASAMGFVLIKRWPSPVDMVTLVSWQLTAGGIILLPVALLVEGPPPDLSLGAVGGFVWIGTVGTVIAYMCWFHGLGQLPAGTVSLIGLMNPVVATVLGILFAGEVFGWTAAAGLGLVLGGVVAGQPAFARRLAGSDAAAGSTVPCGCEPAVGDLDDTRGQTIDSAIGNHAESRRPAPRADVLASSQMPTRPGRQPGPNEPATRPDHAGSGPTHQEYR